jgi:hypothetical protein
VFRADAKLPGVPAGVPQQPVIGRQEHVHAAVFGARSGRKGEHAPSLPLYPINLSYWAWLPIQNQSTPSATSTPIARWCSPILAGQNVPTLLKWRDGYRGSAFNWVHALCASF